MHKDYNNTTDIYSIIMSYLQLLKSNWFIFVLSIIICSVITCLYICYTPKIYESNVQIMLKEDNWQSISGLDKMIVLNEFNSSSSKTNINDEIEIIRSKKMMDKVVERLHFDIRYTIKNCFKTIELYSLPIELSFCEKPNNDNFSFTIIPIEGNKVRLKDFKKASTPIDAFDKEIIVGDTFSTPIGKMVFLSNDNLLPNYINKEIFVTKYDTEKLKTHFAEKLTVSTTKNSNIIKLSVNDYSIVRADKILNTLLAVYNEEYNACKEQTIENISTFIDERIEIIEQELSKIEKNNSKIEGYLKPQENLYLYFLQKREINELAKTITTNYIVINETMGNDSPIAPQRNKVILLAIFVGLLIPFSFLFIKETLKKSIQFPNDVVDNINIPFIGIIPEHKQTKRNGLSALLKTNGNPNNIFVVNNDIFCSVSESFRVVCSNVNFIKTNNKSDIKRIMVTSTEDNSGKSFVSLNLSINLAATGKKVALLDLDFRKATISKFIASPAIGIANYLDNTKLSIDEIAQKEQFQPNVTIFPIGSLPENPAELLFGNRLTELMDNLDQLYDYILIDTTSIKMADASILSTMAEMTLFVIRENLTNKNRIAELENLYKDKRYKNMAILYNGLQNS